VPPERAYDDDPIVTKRDPDGIPISSSSQPTIMAMMLDQLGLAPGQRVLEIGAGTGYNAALIAHAVGDQGEVVSIDIDADIVQRARAALAACGCRGVTVVCADGADGYPARAPFDRVIATVGVWELAPAWLRQLAPDGRIVVPLDLRGVQRSIAFERAPAGERWAGRSVVPCGFMRLRGAFAGPEQTRVLDPETELLLTVPDDREIDNRVRAALAGPADEHPTGVAASQPQVFDGFALWLAVHEPRWCTLSEVDYGVTAGVLDGESVAALVHRPDGELTASGYGPAGNRLAADLVAHLRSWVAAGRPTSDGLRVDGYPRSTPDDRLRGSHVIDKHHMRFALSWPDPPNPPDPPDPPGAPGPPGAPDAGAARPA
jgi:protein-L-isoaspartate(D-aspartate) O-methyltransferase